MEQKFEKIKELKFKIMIELEKAEVLLKICQDEITINDLEKKEISVISGIVYDTILFCSKLNEDIERVLLDAPLHTSVQ